MRYSVPFQVSGENEILRNSAVRSANYRIKKHVKKGANINKRYLLDSYKQSLSGFNIFAG